MEGGNEAANIVRLTPEEHFVAHQLLVHMHPEVPRLIFALRALGMNRDGKRPTNKLVGWMRRRFAAATRLMKAGVPRSPETIEKIRQSKIGIRPPPHVAAAASAALKGVPKTAEHNAKVGRKGRRGPMTGRTHSEETKARMRDAALTREYSGEAKVRQATGNDTLTPEQRSARAHKAWETKRARGTGIPTAETKAKTSASLRARSGKARATASKPGQLSLF